jgi:hypothetical protein
MHVFRKLLNRYPLVLVIALTICGFIAGFGVAYGLVSPASNSGPDPWYSKIAMIAVGGLLGALATLIVFFYSQDEKWRFGRIESVTKLLESMDAYAKITNQFIVDLLAQHSIQPITDAYALYKQKPELGSALRELTNKIHVVSFWYEDELQDVFDLYTDMVGEVIGSLANSNIVGFEGRFKGRRQAVYAAVHRLSSFDTINSLKKNRLDKNKTEIHRLIEVAEKMRQDGQI